MDQNGTIVFRGNLESDDDLAAAAHIAMACPSYRTDEDDEDYLERATSCFNCRYRRWLSSGFLCMKGFPTAPSIQPTERN
ncbi:hypothetical protein FO488_10750 [Geobacter sp. FeAm09]|nr:hypothetical protein FO488_10750 [Geobacter sp. FeAm09]